MGNVKAVEREPGGGTGAALIARRTAIRTQRRKWKRAAGNWDSHAGADLGAVIEQVLAEISTTGAEDAIDIGAGTGALTVPLAPRVARIIALDVSDSMLSKLEERARREGLDNIEICVASIEEFDLQPGSVDLIVSNYALHHLLDRDKELFVKRAASWLSPGGRLVIGDMMFGRGTTAADRAIIASKVRVFAKRGISGWWRIAKNGWRFIVRLSERPLSMEQWMTLLNQAGFVDVVGRRVVAEAAVVSARAPGGGNS